MKIKGDVTTEENATCLVYFEAAQYLSKMSAEASLPLSKRFRGSFNH